jgi:hypothetical protein
VSTDTAVEEPFAGSPPLVFQATFHVGGDEQARTLASRMIETAHQLANLPEFECDVDVSVSRSEPAPGALNQAAPAARGRPAKR